MRVFSAKIHDGAIVADGDLDLPEGSSVTVVVDADERSFSLAPEDEDELVGRMEEADRGEVIRVQIDPGHAARPKMGSGDGMFC